VDDNGAITLIIGAGVRASGTRKASQPGLAELDGMATYWVAIPTVVDLDQTVDEASV